jgi:hypothetical protein
MVLQGQLCGRVGRCRGFEGPLIERALIFFGDRIDFGGFESTPTIRGLVASMSSVASICGRRDDRIDDRVHGRFAAKAASILVRPFVVFGARSLIRSERPCEP